jgi:hypothetical protein
MAKFIAEFSCDNAAFDGPDALRPEIARMLRELAGRVERSDSPDGPIYDANGNAIGAWLVKE